MYLADKIGNEYLNWRSGDNIYITAPTGCGKSYFILYSLLGRAICNDEKILYLVNRKVLKNQIEEEIKTDVWRKMYRRYQIDTLNPFIRVRTYQSIEEQISNGGINQLINEISDYNIVVYDECHYFYADSDYNTNTQLSYDFLRNYCECKIEIFMSATIDNIKLNLESYHPSFWPNSLGLPELYFVEKYNKERRKIEYCMEGSYDYLKICAFSSIEELVYRIKDNAIKKNEKWLIFTDSIDRGKEIKSSILKEKKLEDESNKDSNRKKVQKESDVKKEQEQNNVIVKEDIVLIDADYEKNDEAAESVKEVTEEKLIRKKIIITTAVLDNGISFQDCGLRNIVIFADTKEEFIQMLGRKRFDQNEVYLYIYKQNIFHFKKRYRQIDRTFNILQKCKKLINKIYDRDSSISEEGILIQHYPPIPIEPLKTLIVPNSFNPKEALHLQNNILKSIMSDVKFYESARKFIYVVDGKLAINKFAEKKMVNLRAFYMDMISALEKDENAFSNKQIEWLGLDVKEYNRSIEEEKNRLIYYIEQEFKKL